MPCRSGCSSTRRAEEPPSSTSLLFAIVAHDRPFKFGVFHKLNYVEISWVGLDLRKGHAG